MLSAQHADASSGSALSRSLHALAGQSSGLTGAAQPTSGFASVLSKLAAARNDAASSRARLYGGQRSGSKSASQPPLKLTLIGAAPTAGATSSTPPSQQLVRCVRQLLDFDADLADLKLDYSSFYRQAELVAAYSLRTGDQAPLLDLYDATKVEMEKSLTALNRKLRSTLPTGSDASAEQLQAEQTWLSNFAHSWNTWKGRTSLVANVLLPLDRSTFTALQRGGKGEQESRLMLSDLAIQSFAHQVMQDEMLSASILPFTIRAVNTFYRKPQVEELPLGLSPSGKQALPQPSAEAITLRKLYVESILVLFQETESYERLRKSMLAAVSDYYRVVSAAKLEQSKAVVSGDAAGDASTKPSAEALYVHWAAASLDAEKAISEWLFDDERGRDRARVLALEQIGEKHAEALCKGFAVLFENVNTATLGNAFDIFKLASKAVRSRTKDVIQPLSYLRSAFSEYIRVKVEEIVKDKTKDDQMIERLLQVKSGMDRISSEAFKSDLDFAATQRDAFAWGINRRDNKPPELVAKHLDVLLKSGNKTMTDSELETALNDSLVLFRFTKDKDMFEEFYTRHFAKRLLLNKSASSDAEMSMLLKLKEECGPDFTRKLETMLKDISLSDDIMKAWESFETKARGNGKIPYEFDLSVNVLTQAHWPTYEQHELIVPAEMASAIDAFNTFYQGRNSGRKLHWQHSLGSNTIVAQLPKAGAKELLVSTYQAVVLMLFNAIEAGKTLSYKEIQAAVGLDEAELKRTLQSLACGQIPTRVLRKHPQGKDVEEGDAFSVNENLKNDRLRIRINMIQQQISVQEQKDTEQRVLIDRDLVLQAAAVRVLKSKKEIKHSDLTNEVIEQIKGRFTIEAKELKKCFEQLLDKEYMERVEGQRGMYRYVA